MNNRCNRLINKYNLKKFCKINVSMHKIAVLYNTITVIVLYRNKALFKILIKYMFH